MIDVKLNELLERLHSDTEKALDNVTIEELEDQFACSCDWRDTGRCKRAAVYIGHCRFCEYSKIVCVPCRDRHYSERLLMPEPFIQCLHCGRPCRTVDELFEWIPIKEAV